MKKLAQIITLFIISFLLITSCDSTVTVNSKIPALLSSPSLEPVNIQKSQTPSLPSPVTQSITPSNPPAIIPSIIPSVMPISSPALPVKDAPAIDEFTPVSGSMGDYCTIKGKKFGQRGGRVLFYRKNSSSSPELGQLVFWNDEKVVISVPDINAYNYDVIVETVDHIKSNAKEFIVFGGAKGGGGGGGGGGGLVVSPPPPPSPNPTPSIASLNPTAAITGDPDFVITVTGTNFVSSSIVNFKGAEMTTHYVSSTQLTADIPAASISVSGTVYVFVKNPAPGGGNSNSVTFNVSPPNPAPTLIAIAPTETLINSPDFTLTVNGTNFIQSSFINFNGEAINTTYISANELTCTIPTTKVATASTVPVTVTNPAPGGGTSLPQNFTIKNPAPIITELSPVFTDENTEVNPLIIKGTNFLSDSKVKFNGSEYPPTSISSTEIKVVIPSIEITPPGAKPVVVENPAPGGGSANANFYVGNPVPVITSFNPAYAAKNGEGVVKILGANFVAGSEVTFKGNPKTVTYISSTELRFNITYTDTNTTGKFPIQVTNIAPGGGPATKDYTIPGLVTTISGLGGRSWGAIGGQQHTRVVYYSDPPNSLNLALITISWPDCCCWGCWMSYFSIVNLDTYNIDAQFNLSYMGTPAVDLTRKIALVTIRDSYALKIYDLDPSHGTYLQEIANLGGLNYPKNIYVDEANARAYITRGNRDGNGNRIDKINIENPSIPILMSSLYLSGNYLISSALNPIDLKVMGLDVENSTIYMLDTLKGSQTSISMNYPKSIKVDIPNQRAFVSGRHDSSRYINIINLNTYQTVKSYGSSYGLDRNLGNLDYDPVNNRVAIASRSVEELNKITVINLTDNTYFSINPTNVGRTCAIAFISNGQLIAVDRYNSNADIIQLP